MTKRSRFSRWIRYIAAPLIALIAVCSGAVPNALQASQRIIVAPSTVKLPSGLATNFRVHLALPTFSNYRSLSNFPPPGVPRRVRPHFARVPVVSFFPADLANDQNKPVVLSAASHNLYVNCAASCWGDPEGFLRNLGRSAFIHLIDQYVGITSANRYTVGTSLPVKWTIHNQKIDVSELVQIVDAAAAKLGTGNKHIYHVFLPAGIDTCTDEASKICYSPDNGSTFQFCAYHTYTDLPNEPHVLYTVEPYQVVDGCAVDAGSGNSALENSTDSTLSHEVFETITDPDIDAWKADSLTMNDQEIGDLCTGPNFPIALNGRNYVIQLEYSNAAHACTAR